VEKYIVSFIDILGFSEIVKSITSDASLRKVRKRVRAFISNLATDVDSTSITIQTFSDCAIRARKIRTGEDGKAVLKNEIKRLSKCQRWCIQDGLIVRGGVSSGVHFVGKEKPKGCKSVNCIVSPAMIDAYRLEARVARFPRIIISNDLVKSNHLERFEYLTYDRMDDVYFIDYMWSCYLEDGTDDHEFFDQQRDFIEREHPRDRSKVSRKYAWLKRYHNSTLQRIVNQEWKDNPNWKQEYSRKKYLKKQRKFLTFIK
jgi:hypothetical protein